MAKFILKRIGYMAVTLFIIITATFFLMRAIPGDPLAGLAMRLPEQTRINFYAKYGLDKPVFEQYIMYMKNLIFHFDLGESVVYQGRSVGSVIATTAPISALIGGIALIVGLAIGISLGIVAALFKNRTPDYIVMVIAILGICIPAFVMASLLQYILSIKLSLLPTQGFRSWKNLIMPIMALSFGTIATYARYIKSSMIDTLSQDYILTAQSKGLSGRMVILKHAFRNSILPSITLLGSRVVAIFTGSFVVERIFGIPGIGDYFVSSINVNDYTMIMGTTIFYAVLFVVMQLIIDILYTVVDPRIKIK